MDAWRGCWRSNTQEGDWEVSGQSAMFPLEPSISWKGYWHSIITSGFWRNRPLTTLTSPTGGCGRSEEAQTDAETQQIEFDSLIILQDHWIVSLKDLRRRRIRWSIWLLSSLTETIRMGLRFFYCGGLGGTELKKLLRVLFPAVEGLECGLKYL